MPEVELTTDQADGLPVPNVIQQAGLTKTTGQARDMIKQGAIRIDGEPVADAKAKIPLGGPYVCQAGKKRFAKVIISAD